MGRSRIVNARMSNSRMDGAKLGMNAMTSGANPAWPRPATVAAMSAIAIVMRSAWRDQIGPPAPRLSSRQMVGSSTAWIPPIALVATAIGAAANV